MAQPDNDDNGWERWRGETSATLSEILRNQSEMKHCMDRFSSDRLKMIEDLDALRADFREIRGLTWRAILIGIGAWTALGTIATWLWLHILH